MIRLCLIVCVCGLLSVMLNGTPKKGVSHWAAKFMCDDFVALNNMAWWYDWGKNLSIYHNNNICSNVIDQYASTYVPMIWSYYNKTVVHLQPNTTYVLAFNEPNHRKQANRTPAKAISFWEKVENKSEGREIVSPSAAPCGKDCISNTTEWFDEFFANCIGCRVDYLATHTYYCSVNKTMTFLQMLHQRYNKKIWLTEFACGNNNTNPEKQLKFMKKILPELEAADYIYRYAWFTARILTNNKMVTTAASLLKPDSSELTELGRFYNNYEPAPTG